MSVDGVPPLTVNGLSNDGQAVEFIISLSIIYIIANYYNRICIPSNILETKLFPRLRWEKVAPAGQQEC